MEGFQQRTACRICGSAFESVLDLGPLHISAFPLPSEQDTERIPLELVRCVNDECGLVQLRHTTNPDLMYKTYWYRSGTNHTMRNALTNVCESVECRVGLRDGDVVVDIGSNDGTLLAAYKNDRIIRVGFEPSNIGDESPANCTVLKEYFRAKDSLRKVAKAITSIAMFYDVDDPARFVEDVKATMRDDGLWVIQVAYLPAMLARNAFDGICHEHLAYFSLRSISHLLRRHDFFIEDAELIDLNEGSIRLYVRRGSGEGSDRFRVLLADERTGADAMQAFARRIALFRDATLALLDGLKRSGRLIHGCGASTKGNTLLQYFGIGSETVSCIWERQPQKAGRHTVGTHIPIVSEEEGRRANPDYLFVLPWHFRSELLNREKDYKGKWIFPLPELEVV